VDREAQIHSGIQLEEKEMAIGVQEAIIDF